MTPPKYVSNAKAIRYKGEHMKRSRTKKIMLPLISMMMLSAGLVGCDKKESNESTEKQPVTSEPVVEQVSVKEVILTLSKDKAKVGEFVNASVAIKPSNATNKEYTLTSEDPEVAKITDDGKIECVAAGVATITARSKDNASKFANAKLTVLGTDEFGRSEFLFEAEDANILPAEGSNMRSEVVEDDRVNGDGVVGSLSKGDRIVFGVNSSKADDNVLLTFRLMGPSGWLGYWDSIPYKFADWYTIKVNGKVVNTEDILVEGTSNQGSSADYYNVQDVTIGNISLKEGLNTITFVVSNRYDQTTIHEGIYNGTISCWGNIDSMSLKSVADLEEVRDTIEVEGAEDDVIYQRRDAAFGTSLKAFAINGNAYEEVTDYSNSITLSGGMKILSNITAETAMKVKLSLTLDNATGVSSNLLADMISLTVNERDVSLPEAVIDESKSVMTSWVDLEEGQSNFEITVKERAEATTLGKLNALSYNFITGNISFADIETPKKITSYTFQAESDDTQKINLDTLATGATYVELKDAVRVETDKYVNKLETSKVLYGIESDSNTVATISMTMASPYVQDQAIEDVNLGSLGDLYVNGKLVSTPGTIAGTSELNKKDNFTTVTIENKIELRQGKNRISWEPKNYTSNDYTYMGAIDSITLDSSATLSAYKVNFWSDRNTYMDDYNQNSPEAINVTCDFVVDGGYTPANDWIAVYRDEDSIEVNAPGCLYYFYPANDAWNTVSLNGSNTTNILLQNKNKERGLIGDEPNGNGGMFKVVYFCYDSRNATNGYTIYDYFTIGVWNDPDQYGGYVA